LKSTVVPLFEKVLSASDAGRIGRLVLPKACAEVCLYFIFIYLFLHESGTVFCRFYLILYYINETSDKVVYELQAYFPHISHSEGLPLRVQDVKGNEWTFQFRFWPNNNSRMYVLEGVTPCIQAMELRAGDTGMHQSRELYLHTLILSHPYG
jgi:hypothetical protein